MPQSRPQAAPSLNNSVSQVKNLMNQLQGMSNPQQFLTNAMQRNPQMAQVMQMMKGRNPQQVAEQMAKAKGINLNDLINQLTSGS